VNDDGSGGMTLHELAAEYGVSAERSARSSGGDEEDEEGAGGLRLTRPSEDPARPRPGFFLLYPSLSAQLCAQLRGVLIRSPATMGR
jgi:hypothetical protein